MPAWDDEYDQQQDRQGKKIRRSLDLEQRTENEALLEQDEHPLTPEADEPSERKLLKRDIHRRALLRMEDAARTQEDFEKVIQAWDRLDANRERRERYHEVMRNGLDIPMDYGAKQDGLCFPGHIDHLLAREIRKGNFIDPIFFCPYELHEFVTEEYISKILRDLKEEHKELLFLLAVCQYSTKRAAAVRGQTDRNIRKVRTTVLKKLRKKTLAALENRAPGDMTMEEKAFLQDNKNAAPGSQGGKESHKE